MKTKLLISLALASTVCVGAMTSENDSCPLIKTLFRLMLIPRNYPIQPKAIFLTETPQEGGL